MIKAIFGAAEYDQPKVKRLRRLGGRKAPQTPRFMKTPGRRFHISLCSNDPRSYVKMKMRGEKHKRRRQAYTLQIPPTSGQRPAIPFNNGFGRRPFPIIGGHGRPSRSPVDRTSTGRPFFGDHGRSPRGLRTGCPFGRIPKPGGVGGAGACAPPAPGNRGHSRSRNIHCEGRSDCARGAQARTPNFFEANITPQASSPRQPKKQPSCIFIVRCAGPACMWVNMKMRGEKVDKTVRNAHPTN